MELPHHEIKIFRVFLDVFGREWTNDVYLDVMLACPFQRGLDQR